VAIARAIVNRPSILLVDEALPEPPRAREVLKTLPTPGD
jgi:ABC-type methionine transport system ATPase subunit